ncbi:MAG: lysophospholipid acyltransferase family protein [Bacteroidota bacterium]|nr:lysophospholipid acyltransferase family protein [Bacteroidota bacterium]MDP4232314.1 lysophospholipid acyltransferase family protein [Bacteroidota bacterium]MDP4241453.1 lysophospholipid acyltransferase family protein [Bacteroidota bacterium]MDP4286723.1 lysophospholipid acyltransferase family protein [Bacteroidota bacterium]
MIVLSILASILVTLFTVVCSTVSVFASLIDRSGRTYLVIARLWSKGILLLFGVRLRVRGAENIEAGHHYVYVSNHTSFMDIPALLAAINNNIRLTYRSTLTRTPIWGWALRMGPFLMIDRSNAAQAQRTLTKAMETIKSGASIQLFPEGTRSYDGKMHPFKRGAFSLAYAAHTAIIPVALIGTHESLPRNQIMPNWGKPMEVRIGKPIFPREVPPTETRAEEMRLMRESEEAVRKLLANEL